MTATRFHSADDVRDSIESLYQAHGGRRPVIYWLLLAVVLATVVSVPLIKVDVSVGAPGQLRPEVERLAVVSGVDGHIKSLAVVDNQPVKRGDTLLVLESDGLDARLEQVARLKATNDEELADLTELMARAEPATREARYRTLASPAAIADVTRALKSAQYVRQYAVLVTDMSRFALQREQAHRELERNATLHAKGLISDVDFEQQRFAADRVDRELELAVQQTLVRWQAEKLDHENKVTDLDSQARQLSQQKELYVIRAPVDGTAIGFIGLHAGLYIPAGQRLGEISPGGGLQADVYLSPRDIGFVHRGQQVNLQVDAFPYTEWGMLKGTVHDISQDFVQVGQQLAFRAVIDLDRTELTSPRGAKVSVRRGMTVNARFILQKRSVFDLLYGKMSDSLDPTARVTTS